MTKRGELIGRDLFDAFPDNPDDPGANGVNHLRASLGRVLDHARADRMDHQRYDMRRPNGVFEKRWWAPLNVPVFDDEGLLSLILTAHHLMA